MTLDKELYKFFNSFGVQAYPVSAVPYDVIFPYLTYDYIDGMLGDEVNATVQLWMYTDSEAIPNAKAKEITDAIGFGGVILPHDSGAIWIKRGTPLVQTIVEQADTTIKRRTFNFTYEFI